jgi:uncharacterized protein
MSLTYPGVYIEELPSPVHTISGVATSVAAFVGYTARGIDGRPQTVFNWSDYQNLYGGLASNSELSYAVQQFFQNKGSQAYIVRVGGHVDPGVNPFASVTITEASGGTLTFAALSSGTWANSNLLVDIDINGVDLTFDSLAFNLTFTNLLDHTSERFTGVSLTPTSTNYLTTVINDPDTGSQLVSVTTDPAPTSLPTVTGLLGTALTLTTVTSDLGATAGKDWYIGFTTTDPAPSAAAPVQVNVFPNTSPVPQSLAGIATQLQQAINADTGFQAAWPGGSVACTVAPVPGGGQGIRINAMLPKYPDALIAIPSTTVAGAGDLATTLGLEAPFSTNVAHYALGSKDTWSTQTATNQGVDGTLPQTGDLTAGLTALQKVAFNLLSIPDATRADPTNPTSLDQGLQTAPIYSAAITLCDSVRGFLLVDPPPNITSISGAIDWISATLGITDPNGAAFWPRLRLPDPLNNYNLRTFAPSGVVAGVYSNSDATNNVWTAPAGTQATLNGVQGMTYPLSDPENGQLNPLGLNCLRKFPVYGSVIWGARTLAGADALASQWKYVPVRRMALFLESSLYEGLQWAVFQPNDVPLWSAIRLNVSSFMQTLFLKGAFQGQTPDQAYFVKCDGETTTQTDIQSGVVNILVGFAPLEPAEFVVIQIEQLTGQATS